MRLILEGIDGVGKSSIITEIERTHRVKSFHLGKPPKGVTPHQWSDYFRRHYDSYELLSRSHVSEQVYGSLIRGKSLIDEWQAWLLTMQLRVRGFRIAYVVRNKAAVDDAMGARTKEQLTDYDRWVLLNWEAMEQAYMRYLPSDITTLVHNHGELRHAVQQAAVIGTPILESSSVELRGIGSLDPKVLIVGDEFTLRRRAFAHAKPFDFGAASKLLFEALRDLPGVYITNSVFHDLGEIRSQFQLNAELRRFPTARVVALGNNADKRLRALGRTPNALVPHPQFWRRFRYADQGSYVNDLKQIVEFHHG